jgi:hypothetical protein
MSLKVPRRLAITRTTYSFILVFFSCALDGCITNGGYVPPEAMSKPVGEFSKNVAKFTEGVEKEQLSKYRREVRRDYLLSTVRDLSETKELSPEVIEKTIEQPKKRYLCEPRYAYQRIISRTGYLSAISVSVGDRVSASSDELGPLIKALGTNYEIHSSSKDVPSTYDEWLTSDIGKQCVQTTENADPFATRQYIGQEMGLAAIPAGIALVETVWGIIKPLTVATFKNVDIERRNEAIREYFSNQKNVDLLKEKLEMTENYLDKEFQLSQERTAGRAAASAKSLFDPKSQHWQKALEVFSKKECINAGEEWENTNKITDDKAKEEAQKQYMSSPSRFSCINNAMSALAQAQDEALDAADAFDVALDRQLPKNKEERLSGQVDTLRDIAQGKQPAEDKIRALWAACVRYATLFELADTAKSDENQKKIKDAWAAFQKELE